MPERVEESMKLHGWCGNGRRLCSPTNPPQRGQAWGWEAGLVRPQHCSRSKKWFRFCLRFVLCVQVQVLSSSVPTEPPSQLPRASKPAHGHSRASPCWDLDFPQRRPEEQAWTQPLAPVKRPAISAGSHLWVCGACIVGIRSLHPWAMGPCLPRKGPATRGEAGDGGTSVFVCCDPPIFTLGSIPQGRATLALSQGTLGPGQYHLGLHLVSTFLLLFSQ